MKPLIVVPIVGPTIELAKQQIRQANSLNVFIELRGDLIEGDLSLLNIRPFILKLGKKQANLPLLESQYYDVDIEDVENYLSISTDQLIISYHNFKETPKDLESLFHDILKSRHAFLYKIACTALSCNDAMRMLLFLKKMHSEGHRVMGVSMGLAGSFSRVLSPIVQNPFTFACINETWASAAGQISVEELRQDYIFDSITAHTKIYALIGNPLNHSKSHVKHNNIFFERGFNGVYVKIEVKKEELQIFIEFAKKLSIEGLSITMPLKENVCLLVENKYSLPSLNTLILKSEGYLGYNFDVYSLIELIEKKRSIKGSKIAILGAGGVGITAATKLVEMEADVVLFNRNEERGLKAAQKSGCSYKPLKGFNANFDIVIQATSVGMTPYINECLIDCELQPHTLAVEFVHNPIQTKFLSLANESGCEVISGKEIFEAQFLMQHKLWKVSSHCCLHC